MDPFAGLRRPLKAARQSLQSLIEEEQRRAELHMQLIRSLEPQASKDRVAHVMIQRWVTVAAVEGGLTGAAGVFGIPLNWILFTYCQVAVTVSVATAYGAKLEGRAGRDAVLQTIGCAHGLGEMVRASPRILGALARRLALRRGLGMLGRWVPVVAAPIGARLNQRDLQKTGDEALRRFGAVLLLPPADLAPSVARD
ncbi:MAG: hypothetical protein AAGJ19_22105 [Myxococcota bacterium]